MSNEWPQKEDNGTTEYNSGDTKWEHKNNSSIKQDVESKVKY